MSRRIYAIGLLALLTGCGVTVEEVCEDLEDSCTEVREADCERDGQLIEDLAADAGCSDAFDAYLDCIDEASCSYATTCVPELEQLQDCGVELRTPDAN